MKNTKETLGQRIARLRGKRSQESLEEYGIPRRTLQNIESGETESPGLETLQKIADALGVSLDYLRTGMEPQLDPLPDWAKQITQRLHELEKQLASSGAGLNRELWAAWQKAEKEKWRQQIALFFLTGDAKYLEHEVPAEFRRRLLNGLHFHGMNPGTKSPSRKR